MERTFGASGGLYFYIAFLVLDTLVLGIEGATQLRAGSLPAAILLLALAALCAALAAALFLRWGRLRVVITPEAMALSGQGDRPAQLVEWADVERVREVKGPAYQLSLRGLLPGPYLPHGLLRGETVLEIDAHPGQKVGGNDHRSTGLAHREVPRRRGYDPERRQRRALLPACREQQKGQRRAPQFPSHSM